ncbi:LOW QUALITY PROTEIN: protein tyrosine phosphatase non-receptor pez [Aphomia sociella]
MPFKLKLKKTRQYNVASKSLFVISVELLDGGVADCTLSVDSSGSECLDNVCQRQSIHQPQFFGLRYLNRNCQPRWVQLERPLKRQLDKYASTHQLYLRVMYYIISGTSLITDELTRYHYFLQVKNDLRGRISCDCQQAVVLASYSRQAEYGNHDRERHTVEYLKNLLTFPKQIHDGNQIIDLSNRAEPGVLERLTSAVIQHHMALHNMSQAQAEEGFITTCQQLPGYGQESFSARDERNQKEVTLAISITGIRVITDNNDTTRYYRWMDITNVINHKRTFSIECQKAGSASFTLWSPEDGKYVWRMCIQQHTFYMQHQTALSEAPQEEHAHRPKFQDHGLSDSREELDVRSVGSVSRLEPLTSAHRAHSTSCLELADQQRPQLGQRNRALLPSYRPAPDYETAIQQKLIFQQRAETQLRYQNHPHSQVNINAKPLVYGSHPDIHRIHYPDVTRHTVSVNQGVAATDDYPYGLKLMGNYPFAVNPNVQTERNPQLHYVNVYKPPPPYPSNGLASNSTPDLAVASQALNYHRGYINSHVSGSSPDLVSTRTALNRQYLGYLNSGSHNVVNYGRPNIIPPTHGTFNNLASVLEPNPHIIIDTHHISDNIQKVYDERGNIMYSMPLHRLPYQRHIVMPQQQVSKVSDTQEPIYENVPLPWRNEHSKVTFRDRAQSLTTRDEIARLNERNNSHPTINNYGVPTPNLTVPNYPHVPIKVENPDGHYVNAQIIKGVRETSVPKDLNVSNRSINKPEEFENITLSVDRMSLKQDEREYDETPYQSLSTHKVSNNNTISRSGDNVTSVSVPDVRPHAGADYNSNMSHSSGTDSALSNSIMNSTYSTSIDLESSNTTKNSSKEKKRRRWGVFMGRTGKTSEVKSATLGRDRAKPSAVQPQNKHRWSTGLPKFQPLPPSITKETLCHLLERKMSDEQLSFAFEQIPKGRDSGGEFYTALLPQHAALNGYSTDQLPYEDNRVRLSPSAANPHGYINASHITMTVGSTQQFYVVAKVGSECAPRRVAAGVGGAAGGAPVWECAWQVGARLLALVGPAAPHYLPPAAATQHYGEFQVSAGRESVAAWGSSVRVRVRRGGGGRTRHLWHVHYREWRPPETHPGLLATCGTCTTASGDRRRHTPDVDHFLEFISELNSLRLASDAEASSERSPLASANAPLAFLCSRGAGRSGLALATHLLLHVLDSNQELDIPRTISLLHQQRANLIENVHQYKFIHEVLLQYLKQSRLI